MVSIYRDRTSEFRSLSDTLRKIAGVTADVHPVQNEPSASVLSGSPGFARSEFSRKASLIGWGIQEASQKIARLAQSITKHILRMITRARFVLLNSAVAKRSSMFDDPIREIQEMTALIKNDITSLNVAISDLQAIQTMEIAEGNYSEDRVVHSTAVCDDLKSKLMGATKQLQDVLTARTENIKANESRRQIFSANATRESPFQNQAKTVTQPPPWLSNTSESAQSSLRRLAVEVIPSQQMEMSMLQQVVPRQENYLQSRAGALHNVESTISELGGIFTHLATMVAHQGELAIRIDDNMDESMANVEGARTSLFRHLNQISSNRWLLIKIFVILIIFLMLFIFLA
ncbi:Syntaxin-31 [Cucurbita argyrosperma subsp. argyrosperma]|nr:Syntaxin-31 [Cucurbita argyrosperma subsp. argyrosperma]